MQKLDAHALQVSLTEAGSCKFPPHDQTTLSLICSTLRAKRDSSGNYLYNLHELLDHGHPCATSCVVIVHCKAGKISFLFSCIAFLFQKSLISCVVLLFQSVLIVHNLESLKGTRACLSLNLYQAGIMLELFVSWTERRIC